MIRRPDREVSVDDFALVEVELPCPEPGQALIRNQVVSVDPGMRATLNGRSYLFPLNHALGSGAVER